VENDEEVQGFHLEKEVALEMRYCGSSREESGRK
jgi:hypothetical protein